MWFENMYRNEYRVNVFKELICICVCVGTCVCACMYVCISIRMASDMTEMKFYVPWSQKWWYSGLTSVQFRVCCLCINSYSWWSTVNCLLFSCNTKRWLCMKLKNIHIISLRKSNSYILTYDIQRNCWSQPDIGWEYDFLNVGLTHTEVPPLRSVHLNIWQNNGTSLFYFKM